MIFHYTSLNFLIRFAVVFWTKQWPGPPCGSADYTIQSSSCCRTAWEQNKTQHYSKVDFLYAGLCSWMLTMHNVVLLQRHPLLKEHISYYVFALTVHSHRALRWHLMGGVPEAWYQSHYFSVAWTWYTEVFAYRWSNWCLYVKNFQLLPQSTPVTWCSGSTI